MALRAIAPLGFAFACLGAEILVVFAERELDVVQPQLKGDRPGPGDIASGAASRSGSANQSHAELSPGNPVAGLPGLSS